MYEALIAACCALAGLQPPLAQNWSDTSLIRADDDWSGVPAIAGYRGDGLAPAPGVDPRQVVADGSGTPVDVAANRSDPGEFGLAGGVAEFELPNPVVALRGSATASAPHLVIALDTRGRAGIGVRMTLRDIDSIADAVQPVAVQYRAGATGDFANVPGGYVADTAESTPVRVALPAAADNRSLVQVRVLTTDAPGRDEWVGVDDIEVSATRAIPPTCGGPEPPHEWTPVPPPPPGSPPPPGEAPPVQVPPVLTGLSLTPASFAAAQRGPALTRRGRAGAALRFGLSRPATVRFKIAPSGARLGFQVRGRRGLNRMRFSGRVRGRRLAAGHYTLTAVATGRGGLESAPQAVRFRIESPEDGMR
ncbi:MAG TPA: hypothetical protein VF072_06935 [Thermoleophilaceae bacterium]